MTHLSLTFEVSTMHIPKYKLDKLISKEKSYVKMKSNLSRSLNNGAINSKLGIGLNNLEDKIDKERVRAFEFIVVSKNDEAAYNAIIQQLKEEQIKNKWNKDFLLNLNRKTEQFDDKQDTYIEKDEIIIKGSNIISNILKACKKNDIKIEINEEEFLETELVKIMPKWLLYQMSEKGLNFNHLINRKRKIINEEGEEIEKLNYKSPVNLEYLQETYQINYPRNFTNKIFKTLVNEISDEMEINEALKKKQKKIVKFNFENHNWKNDEQSIDIYTDGSRKLLNNEVKAGYSIIMFDTLNSKPLKIEYGRINGIQCIYRAECIAIYRAIKVTSYETKILNIYSDCMSAIQAVQKTHSHEEIISLNTHSRDVLDAIDNEIALREAKDLQTNIIWVESHKGTLGNEEADKWAKISLALNNENYPNIDAVKFKNNCLSHNNQPIYQNISDIIQQVQEIKYLTRWQDCKMQTCPKYIENELNNIKMYDKNLQSFVLKLRTNILPTQVFLKMQYPDKIDDVCKICNVKMENIQHIFTCDKNKMNIDEIAGLVENNMFEFFNNKKYLIKETPKIEWLKTWISEAHCGTFNPSIMKRFLIEKQMISDIEEKKKDETINSVKNCIKKQIKIIFYHMFDHYIKRNEMARLNSTQLTQDIFFKTLKDLRKKMKNKKKPRLIIVKNKLNKKKRCREIEIPRRYLNHSQEETEPQKKKKIKNDVNLNADSYNKPPINTNGEKQDSNFNPISKGATKQKPKNNHKEKDESIGTAEKPQVVVFPINKMKIKSKLNPISFNFGSEIDTSNKTSMVVFPMNTAESMILEESATNNGDRSVFNNIHSAYHQIPKEQPITYNNNSCHQDTFLKLMEEVSRNTDIFTFCTTEVENKIKFCLNEIDPNINQDNRIKWKRNIEKNGIDQMESIMIWTDLLVDHQITQNLAEIKAKCLICKDHSTSRTKVDLSLIKFSINNETSVKKISNIYPNHVNLVCKCGSSSFEQLTEVKWIEHPKIIIVQTDLNINEFIHLKKSKLNSENNIFDSNRLKNMNENMKLLYQEEIDKYYKSRSRRLNSVITPASIYIEEVEYSPIGEIRLLNNNHYIANFKNEYYNGMKNNGFRSEGNIKEGEVVQVWYTKNEAQQGDNNQSQKVENPQNKKLKISPIQIENLEFPLGEDKNREYANNEVYYYTRSKSNLIFNNVINKRTQGKVKTEIKVPPMGNLKEIADIKSENAELEAIGKLKENEFEIKKQALEVYAKNREKEVHESYRRSEIYVEEWHEAIIDEPQSFQEFMCRKFKRKLEIVNSSIVQEGETPIKKVKTEIRIPNIDPIKSEQNHNSNAKELKIHPIYEVKKPIICSVIIKKTKKKPKKSSLKPFPKLVVVTRSMEKKGASHPSGKEI
jgi:ribonuclease HI